MQTSYVSELFSILDNAALILRKARTMSYLEALCAAGEQIVTEQITDEPVRKRLETLYSGFFHEGMTDEDVRRAFQLATLKGIKQADQKEYEMTPDALVILIGHMVNLITASKPVSLLDPAVGTANLLTGVLNQLEDHVTAAYGADTEDLLIRLAYTNANLQQKELHLFHQDGLKPILIEPVDVVVSDPPVGFYPDTEMAESYELNGIDGKAYTHFLFIEQGLRLLKAGGYLLYLIPNRLFTDDKEKTFYHYMAKKAVVLALLQLPLSLFQHPEAAKSILLLQKKGEGTALSKQALLAELPDFSNEPELRTFIESMDHWFKDRQNSGKSGG
ncbi:MAG: class I SAM-dependent methyltransferase [Sporolactobacillus sp.]